MNLFISLALIWLSLIGLSAIYTFGLLHNANIKSSYVLKNNIDAELLIHGPCEPLWMLYPKTIAEQTKLKTYNLALSHSNFADNYLHLYLYLKNNKAPTYMFLYVTPESMDDTYNIFNTYRFAPFVGDPVVDSVLKECDSAYFRWAKIPFMHYAYYSNKVNFDVLQGFKHYFTNDTTPYYEDGYEAPFHVVWDNHLEEFMQLYPKGYYFKWNTVYEKYLRKTIELAQQNGVAVYLYESPVLAETLPYMPNRKEMVDRISSISKEYKIPYKQFEGMEMAKHRDNFTSTLNTSMKGSAVFTDTLAAYIKTQLPQRKK
jgi:hypothetical protein